MRLVRPGGHVANIGVHGAPATLHLEDIWIKNLTITTGLVDTYSTPTLIGLVASHRLDTSAMITHRFGLDEFETAYDVFANAGRHRRVEGTAHHHWIATRLLAMTVARRGPGWAGPRFVNPAARCR